MGGNAASKLPIPDDRMIATIEHLRLEKENLVKLHKKFHKYDKDQSGSIDIDEFYKLVGEKRTMFTDALFSLIDCDDSGVMEFGEFVHTLSTYCTFGTEEILKFCFFVFDTDKNGFVSVAEFDKLVESLHSKFGKSTNVKTALTKMDRNNDGRMDFEEFHEVHRLFPYLLYPAFRLQESMMHATLGRKWWESRRDNLAWERSTTRVENELNDKLMKQACRRKMGVIRFYLCPCLRYKYMSPLDEGPKLEEDEGSKKKIDIDLDDEEHEVDVDKELDRRAARILARSHRKRLNRVERAERAGRRRDRGSHPRGTHEGFRRDACAKARIDTAAAFGRHTGFS